MTTDPRAALDRLIAALEAHLHAVSRRTGEADPAVVAAYQTLSNAFETYDDALYTAYDEVTPFVLYEENDDEDEDEDDEPDDVDDVDDLEDVLDADELDEDDEEEDDDLDDEDDDLDDDLDDEELLEVEAAANADRRDTPTRG